MVWETYTLIRTRAHNGREIALRFLDAVDGGFCEVERVRLLDETRAVDLLRRHTDECYSFCDALSFVVMEQLGVSEALSFDSDFRSSGKIVLLASPS